MFTSILNQDNARLQYSYAVLHSEIMVLHKVCGMVSTYMYMKIHY